MSKVPIQLNFSADLLKQIDSLIGIEGSDRSEVIFTLLKRALAEASDSDGSTVLARLTTVEQTLEEIKQELNCLKQNSFDSTKPIETTTSTKAVVKAEPIQSGDVPDDWIEEPYEILEGFLPPKEASQTKSILPTDEATHDFLEEPDEVLADFLDARE
jgi:hypothetical protein